jgi:sulfate/thiosulfate transport system substrate-binding protein
MQMRGGKRLAAGLTAASLVGIACGADSATEAGGKCRPAATPTVTLAAYSTPREVYGKIIPAFQEKWKAEHDQQVIFQESYGASTTQTQNIVGGFDADIAALSLAPDMDVIVDEGLITHDWTDAPDKGMVSSSIVVFDVRPDNPLNITDYDDLAAPGVEVLTPDPASSGGARWNIVAAYGAAMRGHAGVEKGDSQGAQSLLERIFSNVTVLDKSARDSIKNFESGNGDVAITYENEVLTAQDAGLEDERVIPDSTVLIENPVAVVDKYAEQHCVEEVAQAFVNFLHTKEAKELYTTVGFLRSTDVEQARQGDGDQFPAVKDLWTVDDFGGWDQLNKDVFSEQGVFTQAFEAAQG